MADPVLEQARRQAEGRLAHSLDELRRTVEARGPTATPLPAPLSEEHRRELERRFPGMGAEIERRASLAAAPAPAPRPPQDVAGPQSGSLALALARLQEGARAAQARAQALATPEGQAALKQQAAYQQLQQRATEEATGGLSRFAKELKPAAAALAALAVAGRFAGKASPNTMGTFRESTDLLMASVGRAFVPLFENLAAVAQQLTPVVKAVADAVPKESLDTKIIRKLTGQHPDEIIRGIAKNQGTDSWQYKLAQLLGPVVGASPEKRSLEGLPKAQFGSFEDYNERATMSALNTSDLQTQLLKDQLEVLKNILAAQGGPQAPRQPFNAPGGPAW